MNVPSFVPTKMHRDPAPEDGLLRILWDDIRFVYSVCWHQWRKPDSDLFTFARLFPYQRAVLGMSRLDIWDFWQVCARQYETRKRWKEYVEAREEA